jgi:hypothetical protein
LKEDMPVQAQSALINYVAQQWWRRGNCASRQQQQQQQQQGEVLSTASAL